jgi:hypothetical protein
MGNQLIDDGFFVKLNQDFLLLNSSFIGGPEWYRIFTDLGPVFTTDSGYLTNLNSGFTRYQLLTGVWNPDQEISADTAEIPAKNTYMKIRITILAYTGEFFGCLGQNWQSSSWRPLYDDSTTGSKTFRAFLSQDFVIRFIRPSLKCLKLLESFFNCFRTSIKLLCTIKTKNNQ